MMPSSQTRELAKVGAKIGNSNFPMQNVPKITSKIDYRDDFKSSKDRSSYAIQVPLSSTNSN